MASAASFALGALPPVLIAMLALSGLVPQIVGGGSIVFLAALGAMCSATIWMRNSGDLDENYLAAM
jgi:hypothetical protein